MARQRCAAITREQLLICAEQSFVDHGINGVTVRGVTATAGVSLAMVQYHFGSLNQLLEVLVGRHVAALRQARNRALGGLVRWRGDALSVGEVVRIFLGETFAYQWEGGSVADLVRALMGTSVPTLMSLRHEIIGATGPSEESIGAVLKDLLPAVPKRELSWRWRAAMGGVALEMEMSPSRFNDPDEVTENFGEMVECLLTAKKSFGKPRWERARTPPPGPAAFGPTRVVSPALKNVQERRERELMPQDQE